VVMGPCFRRDDTEFGSPLAKSKTPEGENPRPGAASVAKTYAAL
jgi:hypothetical protein